ncbi:MAG: type IV pili methyl-accepting chemotaxis transducer N-terminal domain-containing protein [Gammaproteobacteria bacterium]|nr:type IV pili methyl-accepting chemotaxis transducer N-terminal domain-containing protein [Gammaproteobacteria bacterium]
MSLWLTPVAVLGAMEMSMGEAINKAGRQRMLTQRIVKAYCQMGQDVRFLVARDQLRQSVTLFQAQLEQLKSFTEHGDVQAALGQVDRLWRPVKAIVDADVIKGRAEPLRAHAEALLAASHRVVVLLEESFERSEGHLVNISGRQRMLTQRLGNLYMLLSWGFEKPEYRADYEQALGEFQDAMRELLAAPQNTREIAEGLRQVSRKWELFRMSDQMGDKVYVPGLVIRMLDSILEQMNDITGMYAKLAEQ